MSFEGNDIEIKKLGKENIEEIIPLRIALQKVIFENDLGMDESILADKTREFLVKNLNNDLFMYGGYKNNELVSICGLIIFKYFPQVDDLSCTVGYITSVYTKEEHRRKGYQKHVLKQCIEFGKELGIKRFKLTTRNPIAMKMYEGFGFSDEKEAKKMNI